MTLKELHERIGWQLEGRLQKYVLGEWTDWKNPCTTPNLFDPRGKYRRRPEPPPMPDEVWLDPNHEWMNGSRIAKEQQDSIRTVRYIRAGAVIPASQIEWRDIDRTEWNQLHSRFSYRIKP